MKVTIKSVSDGVSVEIDLLTSQGQDRLREIFKDPSNLSVKNDFYNMIKENKSTIENFAIKRNIPLDQFKIIWNTLNEISSN